MFTSLFSVSALNVIAHCLQLSSTFICRTLWLDDTLYTKVLMPMSLRLILSLIDNKVTLAAIVIHTKAQHTQEPQVCGLLFSIICVILKLPSSGV